MKVTLEGLKDYRVKGQSRGITSVCSAHPLVLRAALRLGRDTNSSVLIEATCNQVNHRGGYTGMQPIDFAQLVFSLAKEEGCPKDIIILGGDHLGPNPWKILPADEAMGEAEKMIAAYVKAGFRKLHIDTSMGCKGEPIALDDELVSQRAVRLIKKAEEIAKDSDQSLPLYIIGTEVPPPGGADHDITSLEPTRPEAVKRTYSVHQDALHKAGLEDVISRLLGIVVQPGVEFGNWNIVQYDSAKAQRLSTFLNDNPNLVFEAHSTDYQGTCSLSQLVQDGYAILKVGPELTFAVRECLFALDLIASELFENYPNRNLSNNLEQLMLEKPDYWNSHYHGNDHERYLLRHYSFSDRIRYYWTDPVARNCVEKLLTILNGVIVPLPLIMQYLPGAEHFAQNNFDPEEVIIWYVQKVLGSYNQACHLN
ncbi:D-tagatose-bisphosphate aldolase, class II, non-catalytic subunit [Commensalibacter oyaizuii]|uniref:D-tagatose-bisphosphate aldolase, class II, non-catalytic subunit n=1 Tax=Commensalibacter oyaizuii TaxID=3043873 RepID=A0ABT6Q020_9PROT|nr:D-tagatose-bisphosphate aldolase, class II, non-catalytic subunit [Commensalibacter sp. TBRC 16381]MDI2090325.1 D-tagatose-bisphosphate aldolase, class II, non-catalytic subunit [Commensalibacter sp. TBRC 16381]